MADKSVKFRIDAENRAGEGIKSAVRDLLGIDEAAKNVGNTIKGAFTVLAIVEATKKVAEFGAECVQAFGEAERVQLKLKAAFDGNETAISNANDLISELSSKTLAGKDSIEQMVTGLAGLGKSESEINKISAAAVNLANVTGQDLNAAWKMVNATYEGQLGKLGQLVPELKGLTEAQLSSGDAADYLNKKLQGISDQAAAGISQKIHNMTVAWEDFQEALGKNLAVTFAPIITEITKITTEWTRAMEAAQRYKEAVENAQKGKATTQDMIVLKQKEYDIAEQELKRKITMGDASRPLDNYAVYRESYKTQIGKTGPDGSAITEDSILRLFNNHRELSGIPEAERELAGKKAALDYLKSVEKIENDQKSAADKKAAATAAQLEADQKAALKLKELREQNYRTVEGLTKNFDQLVEHANYFNTPFEEVEKQLDKFGFNVAQAADLDYGAQGQELYNTLVKNFTNAMAEIVNKISDFSSVKDSSWWESISDKYSKSLEKDSKAREKATSDAAELQAQSESGAVGAMRLAGLADSKKYTPTSQGVVEETVRDGLPSKWIDELNAIFFPKETAEANPGNDILSASDIFGSAMGNIISGMQPFIEAIQSISTPINIITTMVNGLIGILAPALTGVIQPLINVFEFFGQMMATMILPIIDAISPVIAIIAQILIVAIGPVLQMLAPFIALIATTLTILTPLLKALAVVVEVVMSPFKFVADLLTWVADAIKTFGDNITHIFDTNYTWKTVGEFSSDAFSGLEKRVEGILNKDYGSSYTEDATGGDGSWADIGAQWDSAREDIPTSFGAGASISTQGAAAQYTGGRTVTFNFYENAITVGDGGIRQLAVEIRTQLQALEAVGM